MSLPDALPVGLLSDLPIGIVIPAYNEADSIVSLLSTIQNHLPSVKLVVVDDSPNDDTRQAVEQAALPQVHLIRRQGKLGRGSAVLTGLSYLLEQGCQSLVEMDADFSHDPAELPGLLEALHTNRYDLLIGSRYLPTSAIRDWPVKRRIFSRLANALARFLLKIPVSDYTNGYRFYSRPAAQVVVDHCGRQLTGFIMLSEVLLTLHDRGFRIGERPTVFVNRVRGESSVTWREVSRSLLGLLQLWRTRHRAAPAPSSATQG